MQVKYCSEVIQMLIGFFYKHYPNSRLATCVSVIAGSFLCIAGAFITMIIFSSSDMDTGERTAFLIMAAVFAGLYAAFRFLAKWIDARKTAKMSSENINNMKGANGMEEPTQTTTQKPKKKRPWLLIIIGVLLVILIGAKITGSQGKKNEDSQPTKELTETEDDGSLPASLRGSVGEMKTFDCYYIESAYVYDPENPGRVLFAKGQYSGMDYLCKVYISRERYDTDCVYLHIAVDDFEEVFGENAASTAGASGTIVFNNIDKDTVVFARLYDEPIQITGKIMDSEELGPFNSWFKDISDKTRLMDFISVSY